MFPYLVVISSNVRAAQLQLDFAFCEVKKKKL